MTTASDPIVIRIAEADSRRRMRFRTAFALTWIVMVGGFIVWLFTIDRFDPAFILEQGPYILWGAPLTVIDLLTSIVFAVGFALMGAMGRISRRTRSSTRWRASTCPPCVARR